MDKDVYIGFFEYDQNEDGLGMQKRMNFVKKIAKEKYHVQNTDIAISAYGKPYFKYDDRVKFNISHEGKVCVIGFATREIGIDIGRIYPVCTKIINKYYSVDEKELIAKYSDDPYMRKIKEVEIWTRKEAHCKCTGEGITKENLLWDTILSEGFIIKSICIADYVMSVCFSNKQS